MTIKNPRSPRHWLNLWPVAVLTFLSVAMFGDLLIDPSNVVGQKDTDVALQFLPWRKFGFDELRHGHLALWNPHIFGGAPYFAGFQSALLYPPNWLHLFMPVGLAINWITALHVFLAGWFMYLWCKDRALAKPAALLAGVMYMFSGPYFLHVFAGHLPHIAIMVWTPLLLLAIDLACEGQFVRATLLGIFAVSMLLLAGHPQYVYYTGMACAVYTLLNLIWLPQRPGLQPGGEQQVAPGANALPTEVGRPLDYRSPEVTKHPARIRGFALLTCAIIAVGGAAITSIQLLSGMDAASESVRSGGIKYEFAATFSFPPENLLTLFAPNALGRLNLSSDPNYPDDYFGRDYLWETSLTLSVTGVILAGYGAIASTRQQRRGAIVMVIVCLILALGAHTPVHKWLYNILPGFDSFRGSTKFIYLVAIFICLLAACGLDALLRAGRASIGLLIGVGATIVVVFIFASVIRLSAHNGAQGVWAHALRSTMENASDAKEMYYDPTKLGDVKFLSHSGDLASGGLFIACGIIVLILAILAATRRSIRFAYALIALAAIELFSYGRSTRVTMPVDLKLPFDQWMSAAKSAPPDSRLLDANPNSGLNNLGMWFGYNEIWGYDPGVLKRYSELVTASQQYSADDATQYVAFRKLDMHVFPLLRCAAVFLRDANRPVVWVPKPMSTAQLVSMAYLAPTRDQTLSAIQSDNFDPRTAVMLESPPNVRPAGSPDPGSVEILSQSTDEIELQANVKSPAILLITNAFSHGWRVDPIGSPAQSEYQLMPADWALQAIPLAAGTHHLRLRYLPTAFVVGKWISLVSVLIYLGYWGWYMKHRSIQSQPTV